MAVVMILNYGNQKYIVHLDSHIHNNHTKLVLRCHEYEK